MNASIWAYRRQCLPLFLSQVFPFLQNTQLNFTWRSKNGTWRSANHFLTSSSGSVLFRVNSEKRTKVGEEVQGFIAKAAWWLIHETDEIHWVAFGLQEGSLPLSCPQGLSVCLSGLTIIWTQWDTVSGRSPLTACSIQYDCVLVNCQKKMWVFNVRTRLALCSHRPWHSV